MENNKGGIKAPKTALHFAEDEAPPEECRIISPFQAGNFIGLQSEISECTMSSG